MLTKFARQARVKTNTFIQLAQHLQLLSCMNRRAQRCAAQHRCLRSIRKHTMVFPCCPSSRHAIKLETQLVGARPARFRHRRAAPDTHSRRHATARAYAQTAQAFARTQCTNTTLLSVSRATYAHEFTQPARAHIRALSWQHSARLFGGRQVHRYPHDGSSTRGRRQRPAAESLTGHKSNEYIWQSNRQCITHLYCAHDD